MLVVNPAVAAIRPATAAAHGRVAQPRPRLDPLGFAIFTLYVTDPVHSDEPALFLVFLVLFVTLIILCIGNFNAGSALLPTGTIKVGGYLGMVTALVAWYASAAGMAAGMGGKLRLPVGPALIK